MEKPLATRSAEFGGQQLVFDYYHIPLRIEHENLLVSLEREGKSLLYSRECAGETLEKTILTGDGKILFNPVEPVNKPKEITPFFLVELERNLMIKPKETSEVMITFPVEIAVIYMPDDQVFTVLDIFSLVNPKYTLYGTPKTGLICRHWKSRIYSAVPAPNTLLEGVMRISIRNSTPKWIEITRIVFSAHDMKIFYNHNMAFAEAYMKILSETTAETGFGHSPPQNNLEKSIEMFPSKKITVTGSRLIMEDGL
ncbi:MAG: DUF432 domain-containing protein [Bacillota bacterium]